jgi:AcrR family transcriptional regulator
VAESQFPARHAADPQPSAELIRDAALKLLAAHGAEATSLRMVANAAGVSVGLVQHRFGTKAALIQAVDDHVLAVLTEALAKALPGPPADPVAVIGQRVTGLISDHLEALDYLARALVDDHPFGRVVFDTLAAMGIARWDQHRQQGRTRPDLDSTWAALNPLILALGALILRPHIDRQLPEPFTTDAQLRRWADTVNTLIRDGQLRPAEPSSMPQRAE